MIITASTTYAIERAAIIGLMALVTARRGPRPALRNCRLTNDDSRNWSRTRASPGPG